MWRLGAAEPAAWLLSTSPALPTTNATVQALGNVAGRFGLWTTVFQTNSVRRTAFDNFSATFFEGNANGNLDLVPSEYPLLLARDVATYRHCSPSAPCAVTDGCCSAATDCQTGLACSHYQSKGLGGGSHASVCVAAHCTDGIFNSDEARADCGGADCQGCDCTSAGALGVAGHCSSSCGCGQGEYPCVRNSDCLPGLICGAETGELNGGVFGSDACVPPHCMNRIKDADEVKADCGGSCGGGACTSVCPEANGAAGHCRTYCTCGNGQGLCYQDDDCSSGLTCGARGTHFGFASNINVCVPASCLNGVKDAALGETSVDCGGACGCTGCAAGCLTSPAPSGAAVTIPTGTAYSQNFDGIGTAGVATLPSGWRIDQLAAARTVGTFAAAGTATASRAGASMASTTTNSIYNFGAGVASAGASNYWQNATDRALGWLATGATAATGGTKSGNLYAQLQAPAAVDINGLTVSYSVEKYRDGTTSPGWKIQLFYSADGTNWGSAGASFTTSFAANATANGYDPAPASSSTTATGTIPAYVLRDTALYLAWNYTTSAASSVDSTSAQALAIDNVSILGSASQ